MTLRRAAPSHRLLVAHAVAALVLVLVAAGCTGDDRPERGSSVSRPAPAGGSAAGMTAATEPPARICGSKGLLGPAQPPAGARRVSTSQRLDQVALAAPPGTTFWLAPGRHRLGPSQFGQVIPQDRQTFIGAPGAVLDGQHRNLFAFTGHARDVRIEHLTIENFGSPGDNHDEGVVNHDSGNGWVVRHNTVRHNAGAGVFIGSGSVVESNCLSHNGQYGFSAYEPHGVVDVLLRHNEVVGNDTDDWEARQDGCGCTGGGKFWDTRDARVLDNWIHDNPSVGLWADTDNTGFLVRGNYISDNAGEGLIYETSYNASIVGNTFVRNGVDQGPRSDGFPVPALYISESGSDPRAGKLYGTSFQVAHNRFVDNWSGIIAWENADRFAGSPNSINFDYSTLVNPDVATVKACGDPAKIGEEPYIDDCRWKTQNLRIHDNLFQLTPSHLGPACTPAAGCGSSGLFSNDGSSPSWSPYQDQVVSHAITFEQDNRWSSNRYVGPWRFIVFDMGREVDRQTWRGAPYHQDRGSTWQ